MLFGAFKKFKRARDKRARRQASPSHRSPGPGPASHSPPASFPLLFPSGCLDGTKVKNIPFLLQVLKIILLRSGPDPPIALPSTVPTPWRPPLLRVTSQPGGDKLAQSTCSGSATKGSRPGLAHPLRAASGGLCSSKQLFKEPPNDTQREHSSSWGPGGRGPTSRGRPPRISPAPPQQPGSSGLEPWAPCPCRHSHLQATFPEHLLWARHWAGGWTPRGQPSPSDSCLQGP